MRVFVSSVVVVIGLLLSHPTDAKAQMVDTSDPCFDVLFPTDEMFASKYRERLVTGSRNNPEQVEAAAAFMYGFLKRQHQLIKESLDKLKTKPASSEEMARMRRWYGCLPWVNRQLAGLNSDLRRLGITTIQLPEDRHRVERERLIRDTTNELEAIERMLQSVVKGR